MTFVPRLSGASHIVWHVVRSCPQNDVSHLET
jgi:hypothetical protein